MWVAEQMGHSDWTMIPGVYGGWMPTVDDQAGIKNEKNLGGEGSGNQYTGMDRDSKAGC